MVLSQIVLNSAQIIGFGFTFIIIVTSVVTLIIKINQNNQKKLDLKLDLTVFKEHERAQDKDYRVIDSQLQDIYKDMEKSEIQLTEVRIFMGAINENLKHINEKLSKIHPT